MTPARANKIPSVLFNERNGLFDFHGGSIPQATTMTVKAQSGLTAVLTCATARTAYRGCTGTGGGDVRRSAMLGRRLVSLLIRAGLDLACVFKMILKIPVRITKRGVMQVVILGLDVKNLYVP